MPFFPDGCDILVARTTALCRRSSAQRGRQRTDVAFALVPTGASQVPPSAFHSAEAVAHGNVQCPSIAAPHRRHQQGWIWWLCIPLLKFSRQIAVPSAARTLIPLCHFRGPQHPGCATSRAGRRESGHQTVLIRGLFDYLFLRSNAQALQGSKNPIAVRCPQPEA